MPAVSSSADVYLPEESAGYVDGDLGKNLTQTPEGFLRSLLAGLVSDTPSSYLPDQVKPLSINTEGRLRVSSVEANNYLEMFREDNIFFNVPHLTNAAEYNSIGNNPYGI